MTLSLSTVLAPILSKHDDKVLRGDYSGEVTIRYFFDLIYVMSPFSECRRLPFLACVLAVLLAPAFVVGQAYKEDVGYNKLRNEVGAGLANGTGVNVAMVEANVGGAGTNTYFPITSDPEFGGKTFIDVSSLVPRNNSGHATSVAQLFFGNTSSMASGVSNIQVYDAANFVFNQQHRSQLGINPNATPPVSVMNHSYIGNGFTAAEARDSNARLDYTVARDKFTSVVALNNGGALPQIYGQSYNSIVVGLSNGGHSQGVTDVGVVGRVKPDIVSPRGTTSEATPLISSAAALLNQAANNFGSANARNSEVMKAIIMAGATKDTFPAWTNSSTRPLDSVFGAGQLNVYNSYKILEAGETNGVINIPITNTAINSGLRGWDYGTSITPGAPQFWNFNVTSGQTISEASILLTWNAQYKNSNGDFDSNLSLANMDLKLFNSNNGVLGTEIGASISLVDNVEHIYLKNLSAGLYTIAVNSNLDTSFGLAWNITAVPEPSSIACLCFVGMIASARALKSRRRSRNRKND